MFPIAPAGDRQIVVDGDLTDWGALDPRKGCIFQGIDDAPGLGSESGRDAAVVNLRSDDKAIYVAVRVLDKSVIAQNPSYTGDCIQLFLDVRPTSGAGPLLGDSAYSDGVYQLMIAAPMPGDASVHWSPGVQKVAPMGPFDIAERRQSDGYTLEMRIPFTSLKGASMQRLIEPIGFDISIDDIDAIGSTGTTTARSEYALSASDEGWRDASTFQFARAGSSAFLPAPLIRTMPGRYVEEVGHRRIVAGLVMTTSAAPERAMVHVALQHSGSKGTNEGNRPEMVWDRHDYPSIGVQVRQGTLELNRLTRGRYLISTNFTALPDKTYITEFDAVSWERTSPTPSPQPKDLPDLAVENGTTLPNGWKLTPAGHALPLAGDMPQRILFSPDGEYLLVNTAGYHNHSITVLETATRKVVQTVDVGKNWTGMALDASAGIVYLSGGGVDAVVRGDARTPVCPNAVLRYAWKSGHLSPLSGLDLPATNGEKAFVGGIAVGSNSTVYIADTQRNLVIRHGAGLKVDAVATVGYRPNAITVSPTGREVAVANWGDKAVSLLDPTSLTERKRIPVGSHPYDLKYAADGRLFVTNSGSNSVSVIRNQTVVETVKTSLDPIAPVGSTPCAMALTQDGKRLYVANADNNNIAVIDVSNKAESRILGFIPTGWYPCALGVSDDAKTIYVGTGKGLTFKANATGQYIGDLLAGHLSIVAAPNARSLSKYTHQVAENTPIPGSAARQSGTGLTIAAMRKIKHVLYIIRENRTYDQVFGDITRGNGDPSLTLFGKDVTPNAHALAQNYVLFDNLYCNGEVSEDGHQWCNAAYATDFTSHAWPNSYSDRGEPDADERLTASPAGYLWDNCARHGLSYYSYGEFSSFKSSPKSAPVYTGTKGLSGHSSVAWTQVSFDRHDTDKTAVFVRDLLHSEKTGVWPNYMVMSLGEDHTQGTAAGKYTPVAHVAANDQALGQIVEAVSHSRFWPETAIFVIEDDAQDGPDHVDAHRTVGLVISPFIKRGFVDSTLYTTSSFVHTMELILGLPPMTQFDAAAKPLTAAFTSKPDLASWRILSPRVNLEAKNGATGPGAIASAGLDFSGYDRVKPAVLNHILWASIKPGIPYPAPVRTACNLR